MARPKAITSPPANITITGLGGSATYGQLPANSGLPATDLQNGQMVAVLTDLSNSLGITSTSSETDTPPIHRTTPRTCNARAIATSSINAPCVT
jgi:hypothetical protein